MRSKESQHLAFLLEKIVTADGGFIPDEAYTLVHKLVPWPAVEVIMTRNEHREFLLQRRNDRWWKGWHIPGGFVKPGESIAEACSRNARKDAGILGATVSSPLIAVRAWAPDEHPFGYPISLVFACTPNGMVTEHEDLAWFRDIPDHMIDDGGNHVAFLQAFFNWRETGEHGVLM